MTLVSDLYRITALTTVVYNIPYFHTSVPYSPSSCDSRIHFFFAICMFQVTAAQLSYDSDRNRPRHLKYDTDVRGLVVGGE